MSKILTARMEGLETAMRPSTIIVCGGDLAEAEARMDRWFRAAYRAR